MPRPWVIVLLVALVLSACDEGDGAEDERSPAAREARIELDLPRPEAGAPDAGTRAGHGGDRYLLRVDRPDPIVDGRVEPPSAELRLADVTGTRVARVNVADDGRFSALLPDLPRGGTVTFRVTATAGDADPVRTEIVASRDSAGGAEAARVRVPETDHTPPTAALLLRGGRHVVS